jgi:hypothetical protein
MNMARPTDEHIVFDVDDDFLHRVLKTGIMMDIEGCKDHDRTVYKYEPVSPICWDDLYYVFLKAPSLFTAAEWSDILSVLALRTLKFEA